MFHGSLTFMMNLLVFLICHAEWVLYFVSSFLCCVFNLLSSLLCSMLDLLSILLCFVIDILYSLQYFWSHFLKIKFHLTSHFHLFNFFFFKIHVSSQLQCLSSVIYYLLYSYLLCSAFHHVLLLCIF